MNYSMMLTQKGSIGNDMVVGSALPSWVMVLPDELTHNGWRVDTLYEWRSRSPHHKKFWQFFDLGAFHRRRATRYAWKKHFP